MKKLESKTVGILGFGEVGQAIAKLYTQKGVVDRLYVQDPEKGKVFQFWLHFDILHICIPCNDPVDFVSLVTGVIQLWAPRGLVIVHSTVPVGITELIGQSHKYVVHSPVRGVHPNLYKGIKTFVKYVGADIATPGEHAVEHLTSLGVKTELVRKSATTELMKLLDTTYYGLAISFHAYAKVLCEQRGVSFEKVMTEANLSYNEGYKKLKKGNVIRPVLFSPENGKIGGHCVVPNAKLLTAQFGKDPILQAILRHE